MLVVDWDGQEKTCPLRNVDDFGMVDCGGWVPSHPTGCFHGTPLCPLRTGDVLVTLRRGDDERQAGEVDNAD